MATRRCIKRAWTIVSARLMLAKGPWYQGRTALVATILQNGFLQSASTRLNVAWYSIMMAGTSRSGTLVSLKGNVCSSPRCRHDGETPSTCTPRLADPKRLDRSHVYASLRARASQRVSAGRGLFVLANCRLVPDFDF